MNKWAGCTKESVLELRRRNVVQHRAADGPGEGTVLEWHLSSITLDNGDVGTVEIASNTAAAAASTSSVVSRATRSLISNVVRPGPGPTSSASSPKSTSLSTQGTSVSRTVFAQRSDEQYQRWKRFI